MLYFGFTWTDVKNLRTDNIQDATLFNIGLLTSIRNRFPERKVNFFKPHSLELKLKIQFLNTHYYFAKEIV